VGADTAWVVMRPEDRLTFNSLAPGTYSLELKARTNRGPWGEITAVRLRVLPPFWATWWFRALMVMLVGALVWVAFRIVLRIRLARQRAVLERERAVLEERIRIAQDLHDDLGSGLASIGMESDLAQLEMEDARARALLEKVGDGARQVSDNMRRIVWALGSGQETLGDLVAYVRGFAAELLDQRGIVLHMTAELNDPLLKLSVDQRRHLLLLTKEALNNVVRHASARNVALRFVQRDGCLEWEVADDGRGYDPVINKGMGTGTASMQVRARALGGALRVHTGTGKGCRLVLHAPLSGHGVLEHDLKPHRST
jgi:signal transduction histidine kinase